MVSRTCWLAASLRVSRGVRFRTTPVVTQSVHVTLRQAATLLPNIKLLLFHYFNSNLLYLLYTCSQLT